TPPAPVVEPPTLGTVTVTPAVTNATVSGTITSVGNNGATACDVYLALDSGAAMKIVEGATAAFEYVISNLTAVTAYSWTLSVSNNAETVLGAETSGSFTTEAGSVEPGPEPEPGDAILPGENAAATRQAIQDAIDAAVLTHGTVSLGNGLFEIDAQLNVTGGVTLVGQGWANTVIKRVVNMSAWTAQRCVMLDDGAKLEGVVLTGGAIRAQSEYGAGALVKNGTISWCCITNNVGSNHNVYGCGVSFTGGQGTIDHSIIADNGQTAGASFYGGGIGALGTVGPVMIDTCLIARNSLTSGAGGGIGIKNLGGDCIVRNCTVVGNTANTHSAGIRIEDRASGNSSAKGVVINTIATENMKSGDEVNYADNYVVDKTSSGNCFFGTSDEAALFAVSLFGDPKFVDAANGDYHIRSDSPAKGAGASYSGIGKDLDGRQFAAAPSIGCYEISSGKKSGVIIFVR
ncbi:MAG: right-handed parallel beta-helix repeat-containing protein, partial [Kiritimatiellae bacterium]|nr:right-handed parallel beta-helix repeat-containing protein [Kiritimatiellia bacterium]